MTYPLPHRGDEMLGLFTWNVRNPTRDEEYHQSGEARRPTEDSAAVSDVIDTPRRRNTDSNVPDHLALKTRPIGNCLEAGQRLCLRFPTQFAHGIVQRSQVLLAARAAPKVNPKCYARKPA